KKCKPKSKVSPDPDDIASLLSEMSLKPTSEKLFLPDMSASLVTTQNVNKEHDTTSLPCDLQVDSVPPPKLEYSLEKDKECDIFTPLSNLDEMKSPDICSSPVPGNAHQSVASSPNISTLISELQLSSIDWESTSFTKSPQVETQTGTDVKGNFEFDDLKAHLRYKATTDSPAMSNSSLEKMTKEIIETNISGVSLEKPTKDEIKPHISNLENGLEKPTKEIVKSNICNVRNKKETLSSREPRVEHLQTLPLKERILLKNAHSCAPYPLTSNNKVSMKLAPLSLHKIECTKSESSVSSSAPCTTGVGVVEKPQLSKEEWVSRESTLQENRKPSVAPLKQMSTNTSTSVRSYTFVKDIKKTSLQPIKTIYAEKNYTKNEKQTVSKLHVKKSTCHKRSSSSEDSDRENGGSRFSKEMHIKNKSFLNHVLKMERDVANVNTHITSQTLTSAPLAIHEIHSPDKKSANSRVSNTSEESDADDSIIAVDSPLPLAERLKLRLLQSQ
ncbi:flap endonuclease GEN homolog 1-like, partial [Bombina bombina]|uniref:flap endonuclease GEN homolog 1-like n=1 Tax=Bombina bombina TaxID=8345 RepID=UPI00235A53C2